MSRIKNIITPAIDFGVKLEPMQYTVGSKVFTYPNRWATVRKDNNSPMGIVGSEYKIQDHKDNLKLTAKLVSEISNDWSVTHMVEGGRIYSKFMLNSHFALADEPDELAKLILRSINSYDGATRFRIDFEMERQICSNGMRGFTNVGAISKIHSQHLDINRVLINKVHTIIDQQLKDYTQYFKKLSKTPAIDEDILVKHIPVQLVGEAGEKYKEAVAAGEKKTAWTQYNGFTNIISHNDDIQQKRRDHLTNLVSQFFLSYDK